MVNSLSNLARFLEDESLPRWLKDQIQTRRAEIRQAFEQGEAVKFVGPNGETVKIEPRAEAVA